MQLILNIGLDGIPADLSYTNGVLNPLVARQALTAVQALRREGFVVKHAVKHLSDSEPPLVVTAEFGNSPLHGLGSGVNATFGQAAKALNQDCIAAYSPFTVRGRLIGPKAEAWGEFNPAMFIMPDGTRLSAQPQEV